MEQGGAVKAGLPVWSPAAHPDHCPYTRVPQSQIGAGDQQIPTATPTSGNCGCGCIGSHLRPSPVRRSAFYLLTILCILLACMTSYTHVQTQILKTEVKEQEALHHNLSEEMREAHHLELERAFKDLNAARSENEELKGEIIKLKDKLATEEVNVVRILILEAENFSLLL